MTSGDNWNSRPADDRYGLRTSWDPCVDLTSPGVVVLDTNVVPDDRAPVVLVLPGGFRNIVRVLVPGDCAEPHGFHDLLIENLSGTEACHVRPASAGYLTVLKRRWPSSLLSETTKRQVDMASLRRDCKCEFDRKFGSGCPGDCPRCGLHVHTSL